MKTTGDFGRYYCFDHETDFDSRKDALKHMVQVHETGKQAAIDRLDDIDEYYEEMGDFEDDLDL